MNAETIREWLTGKPFEPFQVTLSSGETYDVRHPENAVLLKTRLILGFPETDRVAHIGLLHVNTVRPAQVA